MAGSGERAPGSPRGVRARLILVMLLMALVVRGEEPWPAGGEEGSNPIPDSDVSSEKKLVRRLLAGYKQIGKNGRPIQNATQAVQVLFGLGLIQMELDEKDKILSLSMWSRYIWKDDYLRWDPAEYDNISSVRVQSELIWIPDVMLYNTANVEIESREALAVIMADGTVSWYPHSIFRSACSVDVTNYPFDMQVCHLWFGSWTHSSKEIDLNMAFPNGIDLTTFQSDHKDASKWDVVNITAKRRLLPNEDEEPNFAVLTFELLLRRKMVFSAYMLTLPCVFLACLTLVVFWLPPERPDRTALAMNSFASFMVLLLILVEAAMPAAASVPTLGLYYCFNLVLIMFSVILSSLVVNIARGRPGKGAPRWLFYLTLHIMARIMCITGEDIDELRRRVKRCRKCLMEKARDKSDSCTCNATNNSVTNDLMHVENGGNEEQTKLNSSTRSTIYDTISQPQGSPYQLGNLEHQFSEVKKVIQRMEMKLEQKVVLSREEALNVREWKACAMVLDRFFFILYVFLIAMSLIVLFPRPEDEEKRYMQKMNEV